MVHVAWPDAPRATDTFPSICNCYSCTSPGGTPKKPGGGGGGGGAHNNGAHKPAGGGGGGGGGAGGGGGGGNKKTGGGAAAKFKLLTRADLQKDLTGRFLKLLWPDDQSWWDGQVSWGPACCSLAVGRKVVMVDVEVALHGACSCMRCTCSMQALCRQHACRACANAALAHAPG